MDNPFVGQMKPAQENQVEYNDMEGRDLLEAQRNEKRAENYNTYSAMVNEVLDQLIAAHRPGVWVKGSDAARQYSCLVSWYIGPEEKFQPPYDVHHDIRRRIEVTLEHDNLCNPLSFKVTNHEIFNKIVHVGLTKAELVRGIHAVLE